MNIKGRMKDLISKVRPVKVITTKEELAEEFEDVVPMELDAAKIEEEVVLEESEDKGMKFSYPTSMSLRFHFYAGAVFATLIYAVVGIIVLVSNGTIVVNF